MNKNDSQALSVPPKFAVFFKVKPLKCKAKEEKTFTKFRWKREFVQRFY